MELSGDESEDCSDIEVQCGECQTWHKGLETYNQHLREKHGEKSTDNETPANLLSPTKNVSKEPRQYVKKKHECPHCDKIYTRSYDLFSHLCERHNVNRKGELDKGGDNIRCSICKVSREFQTIFSYKKHLENFHHFDSKRVKLLSENVESETETESEDEQDVERVQCLYCPLTYRSGKTMRAHCKKKHADEIEKSGNVFGVKRYGESEDESYVERFPCNFCFNSYKHKKYLKSHCKKMHKNEMLDLIGKGKSQQKSDSSGHELLAVNEHEQRNTESENSERLVEVEKGSHRRGKKRSMFGKSGNSVEANETEDKPRSTRVNCLFCDRTYRTKKYMRFHCRKEHAHEILDNEGAVNSESEEVNETEDSMDDNQVDKVMCTFCSKMFRNKQSMIAHCKLEHFDQDKLTANLMERDIMNSESENSKEGEGKIDPKMKRIACPICSKTYKRWKTLHAHCVTAHVGIDIVSIQTLKEDKSNAEHDKFEHVDKLVKTPLVVESSTNMYLVCGCGLIFRTEKNRQLHMLQYGDYHPNQSCQIIDKQERMKLSGPKCGFCGSDFRSNDALRKHLNDFHFKRKEGIDDKKDDKDEKV